MVNKPISSVLKSQFIRAFVYFNELNNMLYSQWTSMASHGSSTLFRVVSYPSHSENTLIQSHFILGVRGVCYTNRSPPPKWNQLNQMNLMKWIIDNASNESTKVVSCPSSSAAELLLLLLLFSKLVVRSLIGWQIWVVHMILLMISIMLGWWLIKIMITNEWQNIRMRVMPLLRE